MTSPVRPRWPQSPSPFDRIGSGAGNMRPDAQPFLPDAEYVKKGVEIDDSESNITRTLLGNGDVVYVLSGTPTITLPDPAEQTGRTHTIKLGVGQNGPAHITADNGDLDGTATHSMAGALSCRSYFSDGIRYREVTPWGGNGSGVIDSGIYTPTVTAITNVSATGAFECHYLRVGSEVQVAGGLTVNPIAAAAANTTVAISLPVASALAATYDAVGSAHQEGQHGSPLAIIDADVAGDRMFMRFSASATTTETWTFHASYRIRS